MEIYRCYELFLIDRKISGCSESTIRFYEYVIGKLLRFIEENDLDETPSGQLGLWIDFDLSASIQENNGAYYLKPTIKAFGMEQFGRIGGRVLPADAHSLVKVYSGKDTTNAIPDEGSGDFKVRGLKEGNYSVLFKGSNGYRDTTLANIQVVKGKEVQLATVTLHK